MILLTILRLGDDVYGVPLSKELSILRGRDVALGSVYAALDRLELKGLIASSLGESTPERGGRAKRYFRVTKQGLRSVRETRRVLSKLWKTLSRERILHESVQVCCVGDVAGGAVAGGGWAACGALRESMRAGQTLCLMLCLALPSAAQAIRVRNPASLSGAAAVRSVAGGVRWE